MEAAAMQFRVEELNPFMEWHLHTTEASLEVARESAKKDCKPYRKENESGERGRSSSG